MLNATNISMPIAERCNTSAASNCRNEYRHRTVCCRVHIKRQRQPQQPSQFRRRTICHLDRTLSKRSAPKGKWRDLLAGSSKRQPQPTQEPRPSPPIPSPRTDASHLCGARIKQQRTRRNSSIRDNAAPAAQAPAARSCFAEYGPRMKCSSQSPHEVDG